MHTAEHTQVLLYNSDEGSRKHLEIVNLLASVNEPQSRSLSSMTTAIVSKSMKPGSDEIVSFSVGPLDCSRWIACEVV